MNAGLQDTVELGHGRLPVGCGRRGGWLASAHVDTVARPRSRTVAPPTIREHRIPTAGSKPYIAVEGRDGCLWFCESGASKIGRFDPKTYAFKEFDLPTPNATPIGIIEGPDGAFWFAEKTGNKIGRITPAAARSPNFRCRRRTPVPTR